MCKHIAFDRSRWAPCAECVKAKRIAATLKNETALRAELAELLVEAAGYEARGRNATAASLRQDAEAIEARLVEANHR